jgi:amino acid adenylation domain-containing protein
MNMPTTHSPSTGWSFLKQPLKRDTIQDRSSQRQGIPSQSEDTGSEHRDTAYWRSQLSAPLPVLEWPIRQDRSELDLTATVETATVDTYRLQLSRPLCDRLQAIGDSENATLFMLLLSAFQTLLYRYTGQTDMLIGASRLTSTTPIKQPGYPLPLRLSLSEEATFLSLLGQVREVTLAAEAHQSAPYADIIEALQQGYGPERESPFQAQFSLESVDLLHSTAHTASELSLHIGNSNTGLVCNFLYQINLFDRAAISRMAGHFQILLEGIVEAPEQQLSTLPLLSPLERQQQLTEWNRTVNSTVNSTVASAAHDMNHRCLHELFERQVAIAPEAIAVVFESERLSYQELNRRANQLAHHLRSLGVGSEVPVGLCVERSTSIIIAILAILKAGGAYVPLDPATPPERLRYIWADSKMNVLITEAAQAAALLDGLADEFSNSAIQLVNLERDRAFIAQLPEENLTAQATPQNLAYLMYTSGTTGRPKGVLVNHFNTTRLFSETQHWFQFNNQDVWTLFHSYAFDFSVWEIWGALLYGGRLVIVPQAITRWPKAFCQLLRAENITVLNQTPSAFRQVIRAEAMMDESDPLALRWIIFDGEMLDFQCLRPWFERHGDSSPQLINMYGITETTVHVTYRPVTLADLSRPGSMIGQPIPDLQLYILDRYQQLLPIGIPGELYVGGAGLARGYLNRPELTAEKFIPSPFSSAEQQGETRLYKTGDLVRYRDDGDIEYLGRMDHQVKIRGFRVELGAIESQLSQLPQVEAAAVIVREDIADDQRLVAYIVPKIVPKAEQTAEQTPTVGELRAALKKSLPDYMVPTAYVMLEALPLTANGKLDRRSLPAPQPNQQASSAEFVAPRTAIEKQLAELWCQSLNLEQIGIFDSFFELGGHSLLATQIVSQVEDSYQQSLSLADFFQAPTIAAQAQLLAAEPSGDKNRRWSSLVPMQAIAEQTPDHPPLPAIFCVHGGGGSVLMYQALARHLSDCFAVYGLQSSYLNNPEKLLTTIEDMAQLYLAELRSVQPRGPYLIAGYCGGAPIALEIAQRLQATGETVALLALFDPDAIRTKQSPRRQLAVAESVRSLYSRLNQHGLTLVVQDRWIKTKAWIYQRLQRPLTLSMRAVKVQAANVRAMRAYIAQENYAGPVAIFMPQQGLNPKGGLSPEWKSLLTGDVNIQMVPGKHHFDESTDGSFFHEPAVRTLAMRLKETIAQS